MIRRWIYPVALAGLSCALGVLALSVTLNSTLVQAADPPAKTSTAKKDSVSNPYYNPEHPGEKLPKAQTEWRSALNQTQYQVTREEGTEPAFHNEYWNNHKAGTYHCVCCGNSLFSSETKFESGTGWPSFFQPLDASKVSQKNDRKLGYVRSEVHCAVCEAHLGHVFTDGPAPTGLRYCMNSASLKFEDKGAAVAKPAETPATTPATK